MKRDDFIYLQWTIVSLSDELTNKQLPWETRRNGGNNYVKTYQKILQRRGI